MSSSLVIALCAGILAGTLIGTRLAQRSRKELPIYGGRPAAAFHWLACAAFAGGVPAGLVDIILVRNVLAGIALALCFVGTSFIALFIYSIFERTPREAQRAVEDRGWTAEKAKSSGL